MVTARAARHVVEEVGRAVHLHDDGEGGREGGIAAAAAALGHEDDVLHIHTVVDLLWGMEIK